MRVTRRTFLAGSASLAALPRVPFARADGAPAFVACAKRPDGDFAAAVLDEAGELLFEASLDGRGHDAAVSRDATRAVVFARRPGRFAVVLDLLARRRIAAFAPPADRLFAGHGAFSADGRLIFAAEEDFDGERGVIGVYVTADWRRIGEFPSHGVGPHEAALLSDGRTLAVCNGGILNHPDFPRLALNIATMTPSFALIDTETGDLVAHAALAPKLHQLSIRHVAEAADGRLCFGAQHMGPSTDRVPLVGTFHRDHGLSLIEADPDVWHGMDHYVGAISTNRDGTRVAATSSRGGTVVEFDVATRQVVRVSRHRDAGGIAGAGAGFVVTTGEGDVVLPDGTRREALAFDNHVRSVNT